MRNILADIKNNLVNEEDEKAIIEIYKSSNQLSMNNIKDSPF